MCDSCGAVVTVRVAVELPCTADGCCAAVYIFFCLLRLAISHRKAQAGPLTLTFTYLTLTWCACQLNSEFTYLTLTRCACRLNSEFTYLR